MKQPASISLTNSCDQAWEGMAVQDAGRYCTQCARTVIDFSRMADAALLEHIRRHGFGCGRFREDQLERVLHPAPAPRRSLWRQWLVSIGLLIAVNREAAAQDRHNTGLTLEQLDVETPELRPYRPGMLHSPYELSGEIKRLPPLQQGVLRTGGFGPSEVPARAQWMAAGNARPFVLSRRLRRLGSMPVIRIAALKRFFGFDEKMTCTHLDTRAPESLQPQDGVK